MVKSLDTIKGPIEQELIQFEKHFRQSMKSHVALLDTIMHYVVKRKGKQVRPMFVFLSAKLFGPTNENYLCRSFYGRITPYSYPHP